MNKKNRENLNVADYCMSQSNLIYEIAKPLFHDLDLHYFSFSEITESGHYTWLNTDAHIYTEFIDNQLINQGPKLLFKHFSHKGHFLLEDQTCCSRSMQKVQNIIKSNAYKHSLVIIKPLQNNKERIIRRLVFATQHDLDSIRNLQTNKAINHFIETFLSRYQTFLQRGRKYQIENQNDLSTCLKFFNNFFESYDLNHKQQKVTSNLTDTEKTILHWYLKGKSANDTAKILNCSRRTVEKHFENMRLRFLVGSKQQLILKLISQHLIDINHYL